MSDSAGTTTAAQPTTGKHRRHVPTAVIRFAGDSGDGMQLTGSQFATGAAVAGNDLATLPSYPAEIRAPAGTLFGVSSFQLHFGSRRVYTPGDALDCLVAMNPAALKVHLADLKPQGILIVNTDAFTQATLAKAGYQSNPLEDPESKLGERFRYHPIPMNRLVKDALTPLGVASKDIDKSKNFFALGLVSWLYSRPLDASIAWAKDKFGKKPKILEANLKALHSGHAFGETAEMFSEIIDIDPATLPPGKYRQIMGNQAMAWGLVAAAARTGKTLVFGAYPITPATDILHELVYHKAFGVRAFQAEDEIAAIGVAIGACFGGAIGVTGTSGPGICLKSEAIGLAVMTELPLVIINIQRGGPSTGLPTKTEQADLFQALYGRNGECPLIVLAPATPGDCFFMAYEAVRLATKYMTPVMVLSDGYLANGAEPWQIPNPDNLPPIELKYQTTPNAPGGKYWPYLRDEKTLARPWAVPGTPGLEHRLGGIEKQEKTGNVNYESNNHDLQIRMREEKVRRVAADIPPLQVNGERTGDVLVVGWGGTYGSITAAVDEEREEGKKVSSVHIRHLNPLPPDLGDLLKGFKKILVPEINRGQLLRLIRAEYLVDAVGLNRCRGLPFSRVEIKQAIEAVIGGKTPAAAMAAGE